MSIATEISRLQTAKSDIKSAIEAKGVSVPSSASVSDYDDYIAQIQQGSYTDGYIKYYRTNIPQQFALRNVVYEVNVPEGVTVLGFDAFYQTVLTACTLPSTLVEIGDRAFQTVHTLSSITIPNSVERIDGGAFRDCRALTSITIPQNVTFIGYDAFYYCIGLQSITVLATTPPTIEAHNTYHPFDYTNDCPIYVPAASVEAYKSASGWSLYSSRIQAIQ